MVVRDMDSGATEDAEHERRTGVLADEALKFSWPTKEVVAPRIALTRSIAITKSRMASWKQTTDFSSAAKPSPSASCCR